MFWLHYEQLSCRPSYTVNAQLPHKGLNVKIQRSEKNLNEKLIINNDISAHFSNFPLFVAVFL